MKQLISAFAVVILTTLAPVNQVRAQKAGGNFLIEAAITGTAIFDRPSGDEREGVNARALKHFDKFYKTAKNVKWMMLKDGFAARFTNDDIVERVFYYPNGRLAGTLKGYLGDKLPQEIQNLVKGSYSDYTISYVDEAQITGEANAPVYIVHLQGANTLKLVLVNEEDMETVFDSGKDGMAPKRF